MSVATSNKTTANFASEGLAAVDVYDIIFHVGEPTECPLITLTGGNIYKTGEQKPQKVEGKIKRKEVTEASYKIVEKDPLARSVQTNGAVNSTSTTTITLDSNANLTVGDVIRNQQSGEVAYVYAVDSGGYDISVRRNLGGTAYTVADDSVWIVIGYACKQGGSKRSLKSQLAAARERYTQIFRRSMGVTGTAREIVLETKNVDAWDEEQEQALAEHKKDIEYSFWFNPYADSTTDANSATAYITRGLIQELVNYTGINDSGQVIDGGHAMSEEAFFGAVSEACFKYGPSTKALFLDAKARTLLNSWERVRVQNKSKETDFGIVVDSIQTGHGQFNVIPCGVFDKVLPDSEKGFAVVLDLDRVHYRYFANRDTKWEDNIQTPGDDAREAQYITECGLALLSLPHHMVIRNW